MFVKREVGSPKTSVAFSENNVHLKNDPDDREDFPERCDICELTFSTRALFKQHQLEHSLKKVTKKEHSCSKCSASYTTKRRLKDHMLRHEGSYVTCEICHKKIVVTLFTRHKKTHTQKQDLKCEHCDKMFFTRRGLKNHTTKAHNVGEFKVFCETCKKGFIANYLLLEHIRTVHEGTRYSCESCHKHFTKKGSLKLHQKLHDPDKMFRACPDCDKKVSVTFYHKHRYMYHKEKTSSKIVADMKVCHICGSKLKSFEGFEIHMRNHLNEKPFVCQYCGKGFVARSILSSHLVTHTGERKHVCNTCGQKFTQRTSLQRHRKTVHQKKK